MRTSKPIVIAHRGASGYRPEHTLESYRLAVEQGADYIEPDLVMTRDGHAIARHDNVLNLTTDVAVHPKFADRRTTRSVDGVLIENSWFSEDFTLEEIKTLRAIERLPHLRPQNTEFNGQFDVPTFEEILVLARELQIKHGRTIGVYPETKHPSHFRNLGLAMEEHIVESLENHSSNDADSAVFVQSFEVSNLVQLRELTSVPLVQLIEAQGSPADKFSTQLTYRQMATQAGLEGIATYADAVGPDKQFCFEEKSAGEKTFIEEAHIAGLEVHAWVFRAENEFLPQTWRSDLPERANPTAFGQMEKEIQAFLAAGGDGFFTDHPDLGVSVRDGISDSRPIKH